MRAPSECLRRLERLDILVGERRGREVIDKRPPLLKVPTARRAGRFDTTLATCRNSGLESTC